MKPDEILARLSVPHGFGACVDLRGITCEGPLVLDGATLTGVDFTGAHFPQGISAVGTEFLGLSWFREIKASNVDFCEATFHSDARFDAAEIESDARFDRAEFRGVTQFDSARIGGDLGFAGVNGYGNCSLANVVIDGTAAFPGSEWFGGLWLENTQFSRLLAGEMLVHGRLWLRRARLGNGQVPAEEFDISFGYSYL